MASGCGGGDDEPAVTDTPAVTPTPFPLGTTLAIRGQEVPLPSGIAYFNESPQCQQQDTATTDACIGDYRVLQRGDSYILFDPGAPRVIARRISAADEADFRPLLGLISGTSAGSSPTPAPTG